MDADPSTARRTLLMAGLTRGKRSPVTCHLKCADACYHPAGFPPEQVSPISCPDNVAFDSHGNLWIATDGQPGTIGYADGLHKVPLRGRERGHVQQFLAVPSGAETCGPVIHDDEGMVFVAAQHPGENGSYEEPESYFPDFVTPGQQPGPGEFAGPRPSVVQVYRD